jgi:hypothetical protein
LKRSIVFYILICFSWIEYSISSSFLCSSKQGFHTVISFFLVSFSIIYISIRMYVRVYFYLYRE